MGTAHKVISACLRVLEFGCSVIILGILARFFQLLSFVNGPTDPRVVYAISMAAISVAASLILLPPVKYSYCCFPLDMALFICWIVCFSLLQELTGTRTCSSIWYNSYWGVYWSPDMDTRTVAKGVGCSRWRVVLAFSFILAFLWLFTGFLGLYASVTYFNLGSYTVRTARRITWWKKPREADLAKPPPPQQRLPDVAAAEQGHGNMKFQ